uniref:Cytokine receptor-like factor 3 n=1 Tax=Oncorhynchus mykiss TaxID=8022 RepID=A0A8C7M3J4_ONCMY
IRCGLGEKEDLLGWFHQEDVPCVSAQLDDSLLYAVRDRVSRHGSVSSHPPVQIEELRRDLAVDDEFAVQDYRLQYRRSVSGQTPTSGRSRSSWVLHLDPHTDHLFRVCARGEGRTEWSPWSVPQTGYTTLAPHDGISVSQMVFLLTSSPSKAGVLYSNAPTYFCGQTISATGQMDKRDSIGVCVGGEGEAESLQRDQEQCLSTVKEMTNQLPSITLGSAVTFDMEVVNLLPISNNNNLSDGGNFKLRGVDCLFFGCSLAHPGWKVLVF